jgi:hypothetical protein
MERLHFRSTSVTDLQAELHERDLIREARLAAAPRFVRPRRTGLDRLLDLLGRRPAH